MADFEMKDPKLQEESIFLNEIIQDSYCVLASESIRDCSIMDVKERVQEIVSIQELVDIYIVVYNKFWYIEDTLYDYEEDTEEYRAVYQNVHAWLKMMKSLEAKVVDAAREEKLLAPKEKNSGLVKQLELFMKKYGYRDMCGWWVKI